MPGTRYQVPGARCPVLVLPPARARVAASKGGAAREHPLAGKERLGAERLGSARPARDGGGQPHLPPASLHHPLVSTAPSRSSARGFGAAGAGQDRDGTRLKPGYGAARFPSHGGLQELRE